MGSYYLRQWHMRWFEQHLRPGVEVRDISDAMVGFAIAGPRSRELLQRLTHQEVSHEALGFMGCRPLDIGLVRARVARLSVVGELGYEINCQANEHATLRRVLMESGRDLGVAEFGFAAMNSLRLEKSFGIWSREFTQDYRPDETGMDRWIAFDKGDFQGRASALAERETGSRRALVTLEIDATDADASGYEPLWRGGDLVGFITSGGYGHTVGKSLAMALVQRDVAEVGMEFAAHIVGVERGARVISPSPHDPSGARLRA
jgi:dimethylglycine dehydrogenase